MKITVIGSLAMDQIATMDVFPSAGETVMGTGILYAPGGKGNNQCVAAARLNGRTEMIGMVGNDGYGRELLALLKREGIGTEHLFVSDLPTGIAQIQIDGSGQNRIAVIPSANHAFGRKEADEADGALRETDIVLLQLELRTDIAEELIRRAHAYGKTVILNPAPAAKLSDGIYPMIDYITPNESELSSLTGFPADTEEHIAEAAGVLRRKGVKCVIVTCGARGAYVTSPEAEGFSDGFQVRAVDTVAAGDCFNGALAVGLSEGRPLWEILQFANAAAALSVQKKGAVPSLPTREETERFLKEHHC